MEKNKKIIYIAAAAVVLVIAAIVLVILTKSGAAGGAVQNGEESGQAAETTAMYIPIEGDAYLLIDQDNGTVFTATFPEETYGLNGEKITREQLEKGNILKLYGNGIMLESYPGQYPGVSKIEVTEKGNPADADAYQDIVDQVYAEPDPAEPPVLNVEYTTDLAAVSSVVQRGGYEWSYLDTDGTSNSVVADSMHVLMWDENMLNPIKLKEPLDMTLNFSEETGKVIAKRWPADQWNPGGETPDSEITEGEGVHVEFRDEKLVLTGVEPGYIYMITGVWPYGRADFGFMTVS